MTIRNKSESHSIIVSAKIHDCKNILGACLEHLDSSKDFHENNSDTFSLRKSLNTLNNEISDILYHHQFSSSCIPINITANYLVDTVESELAKAIAIKGSRGITFNTNISESFEFYYDELVLGTIIRNIYLNAIVYAETTITTQVHYSHEKKSIELSICDDGHLGDNTSEKGFGMLLIDELVYAHNKVVPTTISFDFSSLGGQTVIYIASSRM